MPVRQENKINMIKAGELSLPLVNAGLVIHGSISKIFPVPYDFESGVSIPGQLSFHANQEIEKHSFGKGNGFQKMPNVG